MDTIITMKTFPFLKGGGEMGELTRNYNWSNTPVGPPDEWPQSLRTTVSNLLSSKFPMFLWWGKDLIQFYNDAYRPSMGNNGKHPLALGQKGKDCWPEIWPVIKPLIDRVLTHGESTWSEDQLIPIYRNGTLEDVYWTFSYSPVYDDYDRPAGVLVTCTETTEKVLLRQRLQKSAENLHNIILRAPVAMCIFRGPSFVVEIANDRMFHIWGKSGTEVLGKPIFEGLTEARGQGFEQLLNKVYTTGETFTAYAQPVALPRNGKIEIVYLNYVYEAFREEDGSITGIMAIGSDVTEQVLASRKIEESEARFRLLADAMPQFVWTADSEGNLNYFNQAVFKFSGLHPDELHQDSWLNIVHPDEREENRRLWSIAVQTGEDFLFQHRFRQRDGVYRWQLSRAIPQRDSEGNISMWIGTSTDIHDHKLFEQELQARVKEKTTELLQANEQLTRSNNELARSNSNLEEFAYAASHDMKEPIRKIHFFADKIRDNLADKFTPEEARYFSRLQESAKRMSTLIDDLLSYSQVSMKPKLLDDVDLNRIVRQVMHDLELEIEESRAKFSIGQLPVIKAHQRQIQQAFQNLISNALKFNKPGQSPAITITASRTEGAFHPSNSDLRQYHLIKICDNGIGFEQKESERIFNVFTRLHGNAEYRGSGVGLSIVRKVVENHFGHIDAESVPGKGTCFTMYLPL